LIERSRINYRVHCTPFILINKTFVMYGGNQVHIPGGGGEEEEEEGILERQNS
jgi:hypothetical protein